AFAVLPSQVRRRLLTGAAWARVVEGAGTAIGVSVDFICDPSKKMPHGLRKARATIFRRVLQRLRHSKAPRRIGGSGTGAWAAPPAGGFLCIAPILCRRRGL